MERGQVVYNASKHAARLFSDCLRREICNKEPNIKITVSFYVLIKYSPVLTSGQA